METLYIRADLILVILIIFIYLLTVFLKQEELEHFPMASVQYVQVATDSDPYSIVALVVKESDQKLPDMHLFHSPSVMVSNIIEWIFVCLISIHLTGYSDPMSYEMCEM